VEVKVLQYDGFDWNEGNIKKAQSHGVSLGEIEDFFGQSLLILEDHRHSQTESRFIAVGLSTRKERTLFIAFTLRKKDLETWVRVISARYAHKKESEAYEKLKKTIQK
jgi:uncharacterized DUF497 family protein